MERLYYVPHTTARDLSVILDLNISSITTSIRRLKTQKYVTVSEKGGYKLTPQGIAFVKGYFL